MKFKKPKFWDYEKPNFFSYFLLPISFLLLILNYFRAVTVRRTEKLSIKTICVGNIYLGGTGKTPLTIKIYEILKQLNIKVATVKKNYPNQKDEQLLLEQKTSLIISEKRKDAIYQGINKNYDVLVFDDGLQDIRTDFDIKLVCFKSKNWVGNGHLIPAGPLREKISSLNRFDAVFLNGVLGNFEKIENQIKSINLDIKIFKTFYKILNIQKYNLSSKYLIFSGIGNPSDFREILFENKFDVAKEMIFPDHYEYGHKDFEKIINNAKKANLIILTTEKDYMKVPERFRKEIKFLLIDLVIQNESELVKLLKKII